MGIFSPLDSLRLASALELQVEKSPTNPKPCLLALVMNGQGWLVKIPASAGAQLLMGDHLRYGHILDNFNEFVILLIGQHKYD